MNWKNNMSIDSLIDNLTYKKRKYDLEVETLELIKNQYPDLEMDIRLSDWDGLFYNMQNIKLLRKLVDDKVCYATDYGNSFIEVYRLLDDFTIRRDIFRGNGYYFNNSESFNATLRFFIESVSLKIILSREEAEILIVKMELEK